MPLPQKERHELVLDYLDYKIALNQNGKRQRGIVLSKFIYEYKEITPKNVRDFIHSPALAPLSSKVYLSYLRDFAKFLVREKKLEFNIYDQIVEEIKPKKGGRRRVNKELTETEFWEVMSYFSSKRHLAHIFYFAWRFGLRPQEIYALKVEDIDFSELIIHIRNSKYLKSERAFRTITFDPEDIPFLQKIITDQNTKLKREGPIIISTRGKPYCSPHSMEHAFYTFVRNNKNKIGAIYPYVGRYSFPKRSLKEGVPITAISRKMGHATTGQTWKYAELDDEEANKAFRKRNKIRTSE